MLSIDANVTGYLIVFIECATRRVKSQQNTAYECLCLPSTLSGAGPEDMNSSGRTV